MTDHEFNYRDVYPNANAKRDWQRSQNPKRPKKELEKPYGFFVEKPKADPPKDQRAKQQRPRPKPLKRFNGRLHNADGLPMPSMENAAYAMLARNPTLSVDRIIERLQAKGYEPGPTMISTIKQTVIKVLRLCEKHGSIELLFDWD